MAQAQAINLGERRGSSYGPGVVAFTRLPVDASPPDDQDWVLVTRVSRHRFEVATFIVSGHATGASFEVAPTLDKAVARAVAMARERKMNKVYLKGVQ